jgi:succinate dehydrogenase/fumarate reductase flavoprotein subunit
MARAALRREESRGGHFRFDFPTRDDVRWRHRVAERQSGPAALSQENRRTLPTSVTAGGGHDLG